MFKSFKAYFISLFKILHKDIFINIYMEPKE